MNCLEGFRIRLKEQGLGQDWEQRKHSILKTANNEGLKIYCPWQTFKK